MPSSPTIPGEGEILWTPSPERIARAHVTRFREWLAHERGIALADFHALYRWSITDIEAFWQAVWDYFGLRSSTPYDRVLGSRKMPGARWFPGARLNYAEQVLGHARPGDAALLYCSETSPPRALAWTDLINDVRRMAGALRALGVGPGDRVAGYLPNIPHTVIAMLATVSLGAIWSCCAPDFGSRGVLDRYTQIAPKVLFGVDGYRFAGQEFDRRDELRTILARLDTLEHTVIVPMLRTGADARPWPNARLWDDVRVGPGADAPLAFEPVEFSHPLWILYSSGTTGLPKPIVHSHGGITLEQLKLLHFHMDLQPRDRMFFYTTSGWMMWNFLVSSLLADAVPVLYDGSPMHPAPEALWRVVESARVQFFGASPAYIQGMQRAAVVPRARCDVSSLESVMLAGSPVSAQCMAWVYENVKTDLFVAPGSGGTDVCTGFCGGVPTLPVRAGEIQAPHLGVDLQALNANGVPVVGTVGEFVVAQPMPSMPIGLWGDADGSRYRETYFNDYPGRWRQGDFLRMNARGGCFVLGRSDATLNRYGVRIGTAEIYRTLEGIAGIEDALIVNLDLPEGRFFMPLFVKLSPGVVLDDALRAAISARLRSEYSPRHVPDRIIAVPAIPMTITGKKMEVPVRRVLMGTPVAEAANRNVMRDPTALDWFVEYAAKLSD